MALRYKYGSVLVGVDYSSIPQFDTAIEEADAANLSFFTSYVHQNFVPPPENRIPYGFACDAFSYRNSATTRRHDSWHTYVVAKINTDLGRVGQEHLKPERKRYLSKILHYLKLFPLRAGMIPLRYADTTDLAEVLTVMSSADNPLPVWIKVSIDNVSDIRIKKHEKILEIEKERIKQETNKKKEETEALKNEEALKTEALKSEEALKTEALKSEEALNTEALKSEEALKTEALKSEEALKTEALKSEEALKTEALKSEEALKVKENQDETDESKNENEIDSSEEEEYNYNEFFDQYLKSDNSDEESDDDDDDDDDEEAIELNVQEIETEKNPKEEAQKEYDDEIWEWWSVLHQRTNYHKNIKVVLELNDRPPDDYLIKRWRSEPVAAIIIPTHVFFEKRGRPVLSYLWQHFIVVMVYYTKCAVMIGGQVTGFQRHSNESYSNYLQSIWNLWHIRRVIPEYEKCVTGLLDRTEPASQRLFNRCNAELDRHTRKMYYTAFYEVLREKQLDKSRNKSSLGQAASSHSADQEYDDDIIRIAIISARCPILVDEMMSVSAALTIKVEVHVFVKCASAVTKEDIGKQDDWPEGDVFLYSASDPTPHLNPKCDVVIFDVFGYWTGNTITPDIIENANNILREDCMLVPCQFVATLTPISSSRIWYWARFAGSTFFFDENEINLERVYECRMRNILELGEAATVFSPDQPLRYLDSPTAQLVLPEDVAGQQRQEDNIDRRLSWQIKMNGVVHGFAGNFTIQLTVPHKIIDHGNQKRTKIEKREHLRYFTPLFIPLKIPLRLRKENELHARFCRHRFRDAVWYDWQIMANEHISPVHNNMGYSTALEYLFEPFR